MQVEKRLAHRIRHPPHPPDPRDDETFGIGRIAKHARSPAQHQRFQPGGQPVKAAGTRTVKFRDCPHVAVNRHHIGKTGKNRADGTVAFRSLPMNNVRPDFLQFSPDRADAALITACAASRFSAHAGRETRCCPPVFPANTPVVAGRRPRGFRHRGARESLAARLLERCQCGARDSCILWTTPGCRWSGWQYASN